MGASRAGSSPSPSVDGGDPRGVGLSLGRGPRDLLRLRRGGFLTAEQVAELQRGFLLDAVSEIVAERGYRAATVNAVRDRAGVSSVTFYALFPNLEACVLGAVDRAQDRVLDAAAVGYPQSAGGGWQGGVHGAVVEVLAQPALAQLLVVQALAGPQEARRAHDTLVVTLARALSTCVQDAQPGVAPGAASGRIAQGLIGGGWSLVYRRLTHEHAPPLVQLAGDITYLLCAPLGGASQVERLLGWPTAGPVRDWRTPTPANGSRDTWRADVTGEGARKQVLRYLQNHPGASSRQLSAHIGRSESAMSRRLAGMRRDQLIVSRRHGSRHAWFITQRGEHTLPASVRRDPQNAA